VNASGRHLIITLALDLPGELAQYHLAKLLISSLLRTRFSGEILAIHTAPNPLFLVARAGVREVRISLPRNAPRGSEFITFAQSQKHEIGHHIDVSRYDRIMFIDCDSVALRSVDHLFNGEWDLAVVHDTGSRIQGMYWGGYLTDEERATLTCAGVNSGTFVLRADRFHELLETWREIERVPVAGCLREQSAFNRLVLDWKGPTHVIDSSEVALPFVTNAHYRDCITAALVHAAGGGTPEDRARFLYGLFAATYLCDSQMFLFNIMEM